MWKVHIVVTSFLGAIASVPAAAFNIAWVKMAIISMAPANAADRIHIVKGSVKRNARKMAQSTATNEATAIHMPSFKAKSEHLGPQTVVSGQLQYLLVRKKSRSATSGPPSNHTTKPMTINS